MKKLLFAAMAMTAILTSCSKNDENTNLPTDPINGSQVQITLSDSQPGTRAFFGDTATAEAWESEINSLTLYVFGESGSLIAKRSLTASEITAKSVRFSLPESAAGTNCSFYAVANADYGDVGSVSAITALKESASLSDYNGTFAEVSQGRKRAAGFVMTGSTSATLAAAGSTTDVAVTLKRIVAKIAVRAKLSDSFSADYNGGKVVITSAELARINSTAYSFHNVSYTNSVAAPDYTCTQTSHVNGGYFENLLYAYESRGYDPKSAGPCIKLKGYFDADGSDATTGDRTEVSYTIVIDGDGTGEIVRNGYYRIEATIKGLSGDGVIVTFTVADWQVPVTQTVDLGV